MGRFTIHFPSSSAYANQRHELLSIAGEVCLDALFHALVPRWGNHEQEKVQKMEKRGAESIMLYLWLTPRGIVFICTSATHSKYQ